MEAPPPSCSSSERGVLRPPSSSTLPGEAQLQCCSLAPSREWEAAQPAAPKKVRQEVAASKYQTAVSWVRKLLFQTRLTAERARVQTTTGKCSSIKVTKTILFQYHLTIIYYFNLQYK